MTLLNDRQRAAIATAIQNVERKTDAELVTVLASSADNYLYIPTLWAALLALLSPVFIKLTPFWLDANELLMIQWATFVIAALVFRVPALMMKLVPKQVKYWRAANLARRQFLENNLHHTKGETGVLIFVCEAEHYVEIIADRGINDAVENHQWDQIVGHFVGQIKAGNTEQGFIDCINQCGDLLAQHVPVSTEKDELPNHLIVLD